MKALVGAFNQEKALVGAFSVIVQPVVEQMEHYTELHEGDPQGGGGGRGGRQEERQRGRSHRGWELQPSEEGQLGISVVGCQGDITEETSDVRSKL